MGKNCDAMCNYSTGACESLQNSFASTFINIGFPLQNQAMIVFV